MPLVPLLPSLTMSFARGSRRGALKNDCGIEKCADPLASASVNDEAFVRIEEEAVAGMNFFVRRSGGFSTMFSFASDWLSSG